MKISGVKHDTQLAVILKSGALLHVMSADYRAHMLALPPPLLLFKKPCLPVPGYTDKILHAQWQDLEENTQNVSTDFSNPWQI